MEAKSRRGVWGEWHIPPSFLLGLQVMLKETLYKLWLWRMLTCGVHCGVALH
jgi:hypothetical protein